MMNTAHLPIRFKTKIIFDYVCSVCFSQLIENESGSIVCHVNADHPGFVTRKYADSRREQSAYDLRQVQAIYQESDVAELLGLIAPKKSITELQSALNRNRAMLRGDDKLF